ncbi:MAG: hypothetical protein HZA18_06690 [Nitrospirae bacterium]|nr:hypothetical protein [Nitrospirota bacterium]
MEKITIIKWAAFVTATFLAILTIFVIPRLHREIPDVPGDDRHIKVSKLSECIPCHSESGVHPLPSGHVARGQCLYCHKMTDS